MDYLALFGIAVGLSMDAFAVALTNGAVTRNLKLKHALGKMCIRDSPKEADAERICHNY